MIFVIAGICAVIVILIIANIRIVSQSQAFVIERLGAYSKMW